MSPGPIPRHSARVIGTREHSPAAVSLLSSGCPEDPPSPQGAPRAPRVGPGMEHCSDHPSLGRVAHSRGHLLTEPWARARPGDWPLCNFRCRWACVCYRMILKSQPFQKQTQVSTYLGTIIPSLEASLKADGEHGVMTANPVPLCPWA